MTIGEICWEVFAKSSVGGGFPSLILCLVFFFLLLFVQKKGWLKISHSLIFSHKNNKMKSVGFFYYYSSF